MVLNDAGIAAGWQVETMPGNRLMIDAIVMPDGNVLLINGAATGVSEFSRFDIHVLFSVVPSHIRRLAMAMFQMQSANRMLTTQVKYSRLPLI
jgi:hypothetical protein